jgi:hypothetical protein
MVALTKKQVFVFPNKFNVEAVSVFPLLLSRFSNEKCINFARNGFRNDSEKKMKLNQIVFHSLMHNVKNNVLKILFNKF